MSMRVRAKVRPRAQQNKISDLGDNFFEISVKALPVRGQANREVIKLLAERFGVTQGQVKLIVGGGGRMKLFDIDI